MLKLAVLALITFAVHGVAHADPCEAPLPSREGATFSGTVKYVGDGDSLCVGTGNNGDQWIEVRLADFDAPELHSPGGQQGKTFLESQALGKAAVCTVTKGRNGKTISYDRVIAVCRVGGTSIGDLLRKAGAPTGGN